LKLSSTKFVLFHVHTTNKMYEDFIAVGERKGTTLVMDRFSYANSSLHCNNIGKITEYFKVAKGDAKCMPFRCLTEAMAPGMDYCNMSFADSSDLPHILFRSKGIMLRDSVSDMSLLKVPDRIKFWFSMNNIFTLDPKPVKGTLGYNYPDSDESDAY